MAAHTSEIATRRDDAMEDGQKRVKEKRLPGETGLDAAICVMERAAPIKN